MDERKNNKLDSEEIEATDNSGLGDSEEKKEDYRFIKEVIKDNPMDLKKVGIKIAWLVGGAVIFGLIAAFVFAQFYPVIVEKNQKPDQVEIGQDVPETPTPAEEIQEDVTPAETPEATPQETLTLDEYNQLYAELNLIAEDAMKSLVTVTGITSNEDWFNMTTESTKQTSGLIVANNGQELLILTEYRAVDTVDRIMVTFWDGQIVDGRYQKHDANTGLTVVKVELEAMNSETKDGVDIATLGNSYGLHQGDQVIAIGSPIGYSNSVVHGQVTSMTNTVSTYDVEYNLLTTDILGSSTGSGVLINLNGEVVGIIAQNFGDDANKNVITGLSVSQLKSMIEILSNNAQIPYLGILGETVTAELSKQTGIPKGVYVTEVNAESPALQAGIQNADVVTKLNGDDVETVTRLHDILAKTTTGDVIKAVVLRKGAEGYVEFEFDVTVGTQ